MKLLSKRWLLGVGPLAIVAVAAAMGSQALAGSKGDSAQGLGPTTGLLPSDHLTEESAIQVDLGKESVRLPLYKGKANGKTVWYVLLDASDQGIAHDLGVNFAPKLGNLAIGDPAAVQTVTLESPSPEQNRFGQAVVDFQGAPDFSPTRIAEPGPTGFPLAKFQPGAVAGPGYSPFIRIEGSNTVYSAPIVATGDGPFDVVHHTNTGDRVLGVHIAGASSPGQFAESWVDLLFVKGFDAGQPIVYISTDAGQPLTSVLERSTYVPALDTAPYNGGDDFLGSARERLFGFINGRAGGRTMRRARLRPSRQGRPRLGGRERGQHGADRRAPERRRPPERVAVAERLRIRGTPRPKPALGCAARPWTEKAVRQGLNKRQIDEVQVFNLAATRPDLLTGVNPATGQPAPYGSVGVDINCAVIGFIDKAPTGTSPTLSPNSQFPPR